MTEDKNIALDNIIKCYLKNETAFVNELYFKHHHGTTIGTFREDLWKEIFEQILPKKFAIAHSVFIIDSYSHISKEVDLAIYDETYTPYIFHFGRLKFIPIEAVAAVIECKSTSPKKKQIKNWIDSIMGLSTSTESFTRTAAGIFPGNNKTQTSTRPLRIFCCLNESINIDCMPFDILLKAKFKEHEPLVIKYDIHQDTLQDWYLSLNHTEYKKNGEDKISEGLKDLTLDEYQVSTQEDGETKNVSLLSLNLQLNQLLMLINNPMPFPHKAYADMFNGKKQKEKNE